MLKHLATPVRIVGTALVLIAVPCFAQTTKQSNGHATKNSKPSARKPVIADLKPTIDNGQANRAVISAWRVSDWLLFSLKKGSEILYCGQMWILPGTSAGGMLTDARGDRYSYSADGLPTGDHMQLLPGSVAIKNDKAVYTGMLDFNGSEYTFVGNVSLFGDAFSSNRNNPLVFGLVKDVGAVYISGTGTVTTQEGKKLFYP